MRYSLLLLVFLFGCGEHQPDHSLDESVAEAPFSGLVENSFEFEGHNFIVNDMIACPDGGFLLVGERESFKAEDTRSIVEQLNNSYKDTLDDRAMIIKLNEKGEREWEKINPGQTPHARTSIQIINAAADDFYVLSRSYLNTGIDEGFDILRINQDGIEQEHFYFHSNEYYSADYFSVLSNGDFIVAGTVHGKVDAEGAFVSDGTVDFSPIGPEWHYAYLARISADGKIIREETMKKFYDFDYMETSAGEQVLIINEESETDNQIVAFNPENWKTLWTKTLPDNTAFCFSVLPLPDSSAMTFLIGEHDSTGTSGRALWVSRFDKNGNKVFDTPVHLTDDFYLSKTVFYNNTILVSGGDMDGKSSVFALLDLNAKVIWKKSIEGKFGGDSYACFTPKNQIAITANGFNYTTQIHSLWIRVCDSNGNLPDELRKLKESEF